MNTKSIGLRLKTLEITTLLEGKLKNLPELIVSTRSISPSAGSEKVGEKEMMKNYVRDYCEGIPEQVRDKIFQPFFTTKPAGSVTGLGLSLSYDIVKAHGGEMKVESKIGKGSEFVISLPIA